MLNSTFINGSLMPPSSPVQPRRDSILKQQGSVKTDKRVSIKQTPIKAGPSGSSSSGGGGGVAGASNVEYISEKSNESTGILTGSKKRQGKAPSGKYFFETEITLGTTIKLCSKIRL